MAWRVTTLFCWIVLNDSVWDYMVWVYVCDLGLGESQRILGHVRDSRWSSIHVPQMPKCLTNAKVFLNVFIWWKCIIKAPFLQRARGYFNFLISFFLFCPCSRIWILLVLGLLCRSLFWRCIVWIGLLVRLLSMHGVLRFALLC